LCTSSYINLAPRPSFLWVLLLSRAGKFTLPYPRKVDDNVQHFPIYAFQTTRYSGSPKRHQGCSPLPNDFSNVHRVLRSYRRSVIIWCQPPGDHLFYWLVFDCSSDVGGITSRVTYAQLLDYFLPSRMHGALISAHNSRSGHCENTPATPFSASCHQSGRRRSDLSRPTRLVSVPGAGFPNLHMHSDVSFSADCLMELTLEAGFLPRTLSIPFLWGWLLN